MTEELQKARSKNDKKFSKTRGKLKSRKKMVKKDKKQDETPT